LRTGGFKGVLLSTFQKMSLRSKISILTCLLLTVFICVYSAQIPTVHSWGWGTHQFITQKTDNIMPSSLSWFFTGYSSTIVSYCTKPDEWKSSDPNEGDRHFYDYDVPHGENDPADGVLPWTVEDNFNTFVQYLKENEWDHAAQLAGVIGHYIEDASNPLHATSDYTPGGNHGAYESEVDDQISIDNVNADVSGFVPNKLDNIFDSTMQLLNESYGFTGYTQDKLNYWLAQDILWNATIKSITENRLRSAIQYLANIWYTGMVQAGLAYPTINVGISIVPSSQSGSNGVTLTYTVTVQNKDNASHTFNLTVSDNASPSWVPSLSENSLTVPSNDNRTATLSVAVPSNAIGGTIDDITVTATAQDNAAVSGLSSCIAQATIARGVQVMIEPSSQENENGGMLIYTITVKNTGNVQENLQLAKGDNAGWTLNIYDDWLLVPNGENRTTMLTANIPSDARGCTWDNIWVKATSKDNAEVFDNESCLAHVRVVQGVEVSISPSYQSGLPGATLIYIATVTNTGSASDTYDLTISDVKSWNLNLSDNLLENIQPQETGEATLSVAIPDNADPSTEDEITIVVTSQENVKVSDNAGCLAGVPPNRRVEVSITPSENDGLPGENVSFTVLVKNAGIENDNYYLTVEDNLGWPLKLSENLFEDMVYGENRTTTLQVQVPENAVYYTMDNVTVTAASTENTEVRDSSTCTTHVIPIPPVVKYLKSSPSYEWTPRVSTVDVANGDDLGTWVTLPFEFPFWGEPKTSVWVCSNGFLIFDPSESINWTYGDLNALKERWMIAPFWCDLRTDVAGGIVGDPGVYVDNYADNVVITWEVTRYGSSYDSIKFQVVLYSNGDIKINIDNATNFWNFYPTLGISKGDNAKYIDITGERSIGKSWYFNLKVLSVEVSISPNYQKGLPNENLSYTITVANLRAVEENYDLTTNDDAGWNLMVSPASLAVPARDNRTATLTVTIPDNAVYRTQDNITVVATSTENAEVNDSSACIACAVVARFLPPHSDYGLDPDNDNLYNYLAVEVKVAVATAGSYRVYGYLYDNTGYGITSASAENYLNAGTQTIELRFSGDRINHSVRDGPYRAHIYLYDSNGNWLDSGEHWTATYTHDQFQYLARLAPPHSDYGLDTDNDNLYNYLVVEVKVSVTNAAWYSVYGDLYDNNGYWITSASAENYLETGTQTIELRFSGDRINRSVRDGPYRVYLNLYGPEGWPIDSGEHWTVVYNHDQFQPTKLAPPHSDYGLDTDNDNLYNYLVVEVKVSVTNAGWYSVYGYLYDNNGYWITSASAENYLETGTQTIELRFKGYQIERSGKDGPYRVYLSLYQYTWNWLGSGEHWTVVYNHDQFQPTKLAPPHSDHGLDTDDDHLYNYLVVKVKVSVANAGWYSVYGDLYDNTGYWITSTSAGNYLETGTQTIELRFKGYQIERSGKDGPYRVYLSLYDGDANWLDSGEHWTAVSKHRYTHDKFQPPPAKLAPPHSDYGLDTDNDNLYNYLVIETKVTITDAGWYRVYGDLYDNTDNWITSASAENYLNAGTQTIELRFNGEEIYRSKSDGSYRVYLSLYYYWWNWLDSGEHWTTAYNHDQFQPPPYKLVPPHSDYCLDTDNDNLYNYLVVEVKVAVATAGTYRISSDLYDNTGNWITSASAENYLNAGTQTIELLFDGRQIEQSGRDGPYRVDMWLYDEWWNWLDSGEHWTAAYNHENFQYFAKFSPPHSDYGLNIDNDNLYNYLIVKVNVAVATPGTYRISSNLYDNVGYYIVGAYAENYLEAGTYTIELLFDGRRINRSGMDGPYRAYIWLYDGDGNWLDSGEHWTTAYAHDQFQPLPAMFAPPYSDYGLDTDNDNLYNYLVIKANVTVIKAGNYWFYGSVSDSAYNWITYVWFENYLDVGTQTLEFLFDGMEIRQSERDGPYRVYLGLYDENIKWVDSDDHITSAYSYIQFQIPSILLPTDDAQVVEAFPDSNYGGTTSLYVGRYVSRAERAFLKFNLPEIPDDWTMIEAKYYNYCWKVYPAVIYGGANVQVQAVEDDNWTEGTITWNNQPTSGAVLDGPYRVNTVRWYSWDVTDFVAEQLKGDRVVSICMVDTGEDSGRQYSAFESKEWWNDRPYLEITCVRDPYVSISPNSACDLPGDTITYVVTVTGFLDDTYKLNVSDTAGWNPTISLDNVTLQKGQAENTTLTITIPENAQLGQEDVITVTATSQEYPEVSSSDNCIAYPVIPGVGVSISPSLQHGLTGENLVYDVVVRNNGNAPDNFILTLSEAFRWSCAWVGCQFGNTGKIAAGDNWTGQIWVMVSSPSCTTDNITVTATSTWDNTVSENAICQAYSAVAGVDVSISPCSRSCVPEVTLDYKVTVMNEGDLSDTYDLKVSGGWPARILPTSLTIAAAASGTATLSVTVPSGASGGTSITIAVIATSRADPNVSDSAGCTAIAEVPTPIATPAPPKAPAEPSATRDTTPPPTPSLISPSNGSTVTDATPILDWSDVSDSSGVTYSLSITNDAGFVSIVLEKSGLMFSTYELTSGEALPAGTYYWRVRAVDGVGNVGSWSENWSFTVSAAPTSVVTPPISLAIPIGIVAIAIIAIGATIIVKKQKLRLSFKSS